GSMRLRDILLGSICILALAVPAMAQTTYTCVLTGASEVPATGSTATGNATVVLNVGHNQISVSCQFQNLQGTYTFAHIHGPTPAGTNAGVNWDLTSPSVPWVFSNANHDGSLTNYVILGITATDVNNLNAFQFYMNVHSTAFPGGEIRGQVGSSAVPTARTTW